MFAKIFTQIFDSSIAEDWKVRIVFEDLLKLCDPDGVVDMTPEAIARRTNVPLDIILHGLEKLQLPDPKSRSKEHDGKRIELLDDHRDWGWMIVNYSYYRQIASEEQRREKTRERVRRFRGSEEDHVTPCNAHVTQSNARNAMYKQKQKQKHKHTDAPESRRSGFGISSSIEVSSQVIEFANFTIKHRLHQGQKGVTISPNGVISWSRQTLNLWERDFQSLLQSFEEDDERINKVLDWYYLNWRSRFVPKCHTLRSFCQKFTSIEDAKKRNEGWDDETDDTPPPRIKVNGVYLEKEEPSKPNRYRVNGKWSDEEE